MQLTQEQKATLQLNAESLGKLHTYLKMVDRWPHEGQARVIRAFFSDHKKVIQGQCGRSFGKTETALYIAWRYAITNPGVEIYIICPQKLQAKKLYWIPKRLQRYGPQEFVEEHRESELRTVFKNGSHIILDGCENYDALRGIKPHLVIYDEFQHHTKFFDEEVMQPNLQNGKVSLLVFGTPPKRDCYYCEFRENLLNSISRGNKSSAYFELRSEDNPTSDREWLANKRLELIRRDKFNVWLREYEGKLVYDTDSAVFPFFSPTKHVKPHKTLTALIHRDRHKLNWYAFYDPGTTSTFGALFIAHNPYTGQLFLMDEIYAQEKRECTTTAIYTKASSKMEELYDNEDSWNQWYDEAAAWFANEVQDLFGANIMPTTKHKFREEIDGGRAGESILNTIMDMDNMFFVSDRCQKFIWELLNYVLDEQGNYPKNHDHLIDLLFYFIQCTRYSLVEQSDPENRYDEFKEARRGPKTPESMVGQGDLSQRALDGEFDDMYDHDSGEGIWN